MSLRHGRKLVFEVGVTTHSEIATALFQAFTGQWPMDVVAGGAPNAQRAVYDPSIGEVFLDVFVAGVA